MAINIEIVILSYAKLIKAGQKTIEDVPTNLKTQVSAKVLELQA